VFLHKDFKGKIYYVSTSDSAQGKNKKKQSLTFCFQLMKENKYCKYNIQFNNVTEVYSAIGINNKRAQTMTRDMHSVLFPHLTVSRTLNQDFFQICSAGYAPAQSERALCFSLTLHVCKVRSA
jgi:hypothetical protein